MSKRVGTVPREKRREVLSYVQKMHEHADAGRYDDALKCGTAALHICAWHGVQSLHLLWALAVVMDNQGKPDEAFPLIMDAIRLDPADPRIDRSFKIICGRLRARIIEADPADTMIPRFYDLLVMAHRADDACHLAAAKHYDQTGEPEAALRILDAITVLSPGCREAWIFKAAVARKLGDVDGAIRAEAQAQGSSGTAPTIFGMSPTAEA